MTAFHTAKMAIMDHGNWLVVIKPLKFVERLDQDQCESVLLRCEVSNGFRYYPFYNKDKAEGIILGNDYAESAVVFKSKLEICRLYTSGLFAHRFACQEDFWDSTKDRRVLEILHTLWKITEIYKFASNLASEDIFGNEVEIRITLFSMKDRKLFFKNPNRDLHHTYNYHLEDISLENKKYTRQQIITSSQEYAVQTTKELFRRFRWKSPTLDSFLRTEQEAFLSGRMDSFS